MKDVLFFSTVWEDYASIQGALKINKNDVVLTICSAGDNALNMLLENPKRVIAIDSNTMELALAKHKAKIIMDDSFEQAEHKLEELSQTGLFERRFVPIFRFFITWILPSELIRTDSKQKQLRKYRKWKALIALALLPFSLKALYKLLLPGIPLNYVNIDIYQTLRRNIHHFVKYALFSKNPYLHKICNSKQEKLPFLMPKNYE